MKGGVFAIAVLVAAVSGMLSLSYEIVWFRVFGFVTGGTAGSFGVVLGAFLVGVAFGSLAARWLCKDQSATGKRSQLAIPAWLLWGGSLAGFALLPLVGTACVAGKWTWTLPLVGLVAGLLGAILPLVAHFGIPPDDRAGERLSWLYLSNIIGSSAGSLGTGFVLLDMLSLREVAVVLAVVGAVLAAALFLASGAQKARIFGLAACLSLAIAAPLTADATYAGLWEKLQLKQEHSPERAFKHVLENRHGVITIDAKDKIYGGGVYDGAFNTQPLHDTNMVLRPYALAGFCRSIRRVLMIGLSSGSWAQIIVHHPQLQELIAVEINPGYLQLIDAYPQVRSLLTNPKVTIVIDDGRRWMLAHPEERFDVIVMNNTMHWRGSATNLLSTEFMGLARAHLRPHGALFYNTTESVPAMKTGCASFKHGVRIINFMLLSDQPVQKDTERWRRVLEGYQLDGKAVFDLSKKGHRERIEEMLQLRDETRGVTDGRWFETCQSVRKWARHQPIITDDNMQPEFYRRWDAVP